MAAAQGDAEGTPALRITGFSIDTRSLEPGDVFVALADARDGHEFVPAAFKAGAAAAIVARSYARGGSGGALLRVDDPLRALEGIGRAARARATRASLRSRAASARPAPRRCCASAWRLAGPTHAAEKSYNNHWGVPLTLARMPPDSAFAVFEIGMNHPGEITPLAEMVRPHVAVITTVEPVHLEYFATVEAIAEAKAEIFAGSCRAAPPCSRATTRISPCCASAPSRSAPRSSPSATTRRPISAPCRSISGPRAPPSSPGTARSASPTASARRASTT